MPVSNLCLNWVYHIPSPQIYAQRETCSEEVAVERGVTKGLAAGEGGVLPRMQWVWGTTLYHKDDLPFDLSQLPDVYTQFRKVTLADAGSHTPTRRFSGSQVLTLASPCSQWRAGVRSVGLCSCQLASTPSPPPFWRRLGGWDPSPQLPTLIWSVGSKTRAV